MQDRRFSLLQIHLVVLLAGGSGLFGKFLALNPATITCLRSALGAVTVALAVLFTKRGLRLKNRRHGLAALLSGGLLGAHWITFFMAIQASTVAIGLLGFAAFPLFVTFLEPLIFKERLRWVDVAVAIVIVTGLVLVTPQFDLGNEQTRGLLLGVTSGLAYALLSLLNRAQLRSQPPLVVAFYQLAFAALFVLPLAWSSLPQITLHDASLLLLLGVVFTGLAQSLLVNSLRHLGAQTVSIMLGLEPVYGILLAWLLLQETPASRTIFGGFIILAAVLFTSIQHARSTPPTVA